jgi:PPK2 family polyphosphate:nucleotide phosphotransferase
MADQRLVKLASRFTVTNGRNFRLDKIAPDDTKGFSATKEEAETLLQEAVQRISGLQETLYAQDQWAVLLIFQAMDAAGKDSAIKHVLSGINPQGVQVFSFKAPSAEELDHEFLWRTTVRLPERGRIGVFNRSYYEEVIIVRVHRELLQSERLPERTITRNIWSERFDDIKSFERHLVRNGYVVRKFFMHVSRDEQARRFIKRLDEPDKRWKFSMGDVRERERWADYMKAYEDVVQKTSTPDAPWVVVPADRKWFARLVIAGALLGALEALQLRPPKVSPGQEQELAEAREALARELGEGASRKRR